MSTARFAAHAQLLMAPWWQLRAEKSVGGHLFLLGAVVLGGVAIGVFDGQGWASVGRAFAIVFTSLTVIVWSLQYGAFAQLNHPVHARLVPGQLRKLRQSMLLCWLVCAGVSGMVLDAVYGNVVPWMVTMALGLALLLALFRWPFRWLAGFVVLAFGTAWWGRAVTELWKAWPEWVQVALAIAIVLSLLLLAARMLTHGMLDSGGAKHAKSFVRMRRVRSMFVPDAEGRLSSFYDWGDWGNAVGRVINRPYDWYAQRLLRRPRATAAHALARAELLFGSAISWVVQTQIALGALAFIVIAWAARSLVRGQWDSGWLEPLGPFGWSVGFWLMYVALLPAMFLPKAIQRTSREQRLLVLLPGMPRNTALNRLLAWRSQRHTLIGWVIAWTLLMLLPFKEDSRTILMAAYLGLLPFVPALMGDWARAGIQHAVSSRYLAEMVIYLLVLAASGLLCYAALAWWQWPVMAVFGASVLCTVAVFAWRWRLLAGYPSAFPAGRLAKV